MTSSAGTQMAQEIAEQPEAARATLDALLPLREELSALLGSRRRVLFAARGSSDNAAIYGRYLLETQAGVPGGLASPSLATHYRAAMDLHDTLLVSVSQSGQTEEILETQRWGAHQGAATVAITNQQDSPLASEADLTLVTEAGEELAVPATKSYQAQLVAMAVLGLAAAGSAPQLPAGPAEGAARSWGDHLESQLRRVPGQIAALLQAQSGVESAVELLAARPTTVATGRGLLMGTALETALKIEETCLRPVRGYSYADLRHGPIAAVGADVTALLVAAQDGPLLPAMTHLADDLTERGAAVVGIGGDPGFAARCAVHVPGPELPEPLAALGSILPAQLIAERLSRRLGLDPDSPQGLAKVTRTDA